MKFNATPDDFLKGELVQIGWHPSQITSYEEKMSQAGVDPRTGKVKEASQYLELQFKITDGPAKGIVIYQNFSEKAASFIAPLLTALGQTVDKSKGMNFDSSKEKFLGQKVDIHVARGTFNNKPKNEIDGYKTYSGKGAVSAPTQAGV